MTVSTIISWKYVCTNQIEYINFFWDRFGIGFVLKASSNTKQSLIHVCSWYGNYNTMSLLIRNGLSLECKNTKGLTPIHLATTQGHYICVQSLLKDGANPNEVDLKGNSTLHLAVISNRLECAEELFRFENVSRYHVPTNHCSFYIDSTKLSKLKKPHS